MSNDTDSFENGLKSVFSEILEEYGFPESTLSTKNNFSKKGKNAGKLISTEIDLHELSFPYDESDKITKTSLILYITPNTRIRELMIHKKRFDKIALPDSANISKKKDLLYIYVSFKTDDSAVYQYIKDNIRFCIDNYESSNSFGCCSKYKECSTAKKCLHVNQLYAKGCIYRKNLENGRIFY